MFNPNHKWSEDSRVLVYTDAPTTYAGQPVRLVRGFTASTGTVFYMLKTIGGHILAEQTNDWDALIVYANEKQLKVAYQVEG